MSGVQVLDVGDRVLCEGHDGVLVRFAGERYVVAMAGRGQIGSYRRSQLTRVGRDLQVGDFVRVTGEIEPTWNGMPEDIDEEVGVIVDDVEDGEGIDFLVYILGQVDVYECHTDHLTRITRAEALA